MPYVFPSTSTRSTVTSSSQEIGVSMQAGVSYRLYALGADLYFRTGPASGVTATVGNDSHPLADGDFIELTARGTAVRVAVIRAGGNDGAAVLSRMEPGSLA